MQAEVARLEKLLSEASVESARDRAGASPSGKVARLRKEISRRDRQVVRLEDRLAREAQASETHKETIGSQGREVIRLHSELSGNTRTDPGRSANGVQLLQERQVTRLRYPDLMSNRARVKQPAHSRGVFTDQLRWMRRASDVTQAASLTKSSPTYPA